MRFARMNGDARDYFWFAVALIIMLTGSAVHAAAGAESAAGFAASVTTSQRGDPPAAF